MKRVVALAVAMMLCLCAQASASPDGELHTLWGIPWGCSREELSDLVYSQKGIALENAKGLYSLTLAEDQTVKFLGHTLSRFDVFRSNFENDSTGAIQIAFDLGSGVDRKAYSKQANEVMRDIFESVLQEYGEITGYLFSVQSDDAEETHNYLMRDGVIDFDAVRHAFMNSRKTELIVAWNNVSLTFSWSWSYFNKNYEAGAELDYALPPSYAQILIESSEASEIYDYTPIRDYTDVSVGF